MNSSDVFRKKVLYICAPYRAVGWWQTLPIIRWFIIERNIRYARSMAIRFWKLGYTVICPHMNTSHFDGLCEDQVWLEGDLELLRRCDVLAIKLESHRTSSGCSAEYMLAKSMGKEIYEVSLYGKKGLSIHHVDWKKEDSQKCIPETLGD